MARNKIEVILAGDPSSLERAFRRGGVAATGFGHSLTGLATRVTGLIGSYVAFSTVLHAGIDELNAHQKAMAQTAAALKSTGSVAGVTAGHIDKLGMSISNLSGINDEVVQSAENILLSFTNVRNVMGKGNDVFDQTIKRVTDLSVRTGKDLPSAMTIVGKALQNPLRGLGGLSRAGVLFDDVQRKNIKTLIMHHNLLGAQKIILAELTTRYKGAAAAAGQTFAGQLNIVRERADDLLGTMTGLASKGLLPYIQEATKWIQNTKNQQMVTEAFKDALAKVGTVIHDAAGAIRSMIGPAQTAFHAIGGLKGALELLIALKAASWATGIIGSLGSIGGKADTSAGKVRGLRGALGSLPTIVTTTIIVDQIIRTHRQQIDKGIKKDISFESKVVGTLFGSGAGKWYDKHVSGLDKSVIDFVTGTKSPKPAAGRMPPPGSVPTPGSSPFIGQLTKGAKQAQANAFAVAAARYKREHPGAVAPDLGVIPPKSKTGGAAGTPKWLTAFQDHMARLQLGMDRAGLTATLRDDVKAQQGILGYIRSQLKLHKGSLDIQQALVQAQSQMLGLKKQEKSAETDLLKAQKDALKQRVDAVRSAFGDLFQGPILAPTDAQTKAALGVPPVSASRLVADMRAQNTANRKFQTELRRLRRRGAPADFIANQAAGGLANEPNIASLLAADAPTFGKFLKAYRARQHQIVQTAQMRVTKATIHVDRADVYGMAVSSGQRPARIVQTRGRYGGWDFN